MRLKNAPKVDVVKRGQKQQKIDQFVTDFLSALPSRDSASIDKPVTVLMFARSPISPVAKAIAGQCKAVREAGIAIRAVFSQIGPDSEASAWTQPTAGLGFARDIRLADNPALLDAHEQLVLDTSTSWMGDCLRREPTSSDAYECYAPQCELSARSGSVSFERLWKICEPVASLEARDQSDSDNGDIDTVLGAATAADQAANAASEDSAGPQAGTRH